MASARSFFRVPAPPTAIPMYCQFARRRRNSRSIPTALQRPSAGGAECSPTRPRRVRVWRHSVGPQVEVLTRRIAVERADAGILEAASAVAAARIELNRVRTNRTGRCRKREGGRVAAIAASKSLEAIQQDVQRVEILVGMARELARLDRYEGRALSRGANSRSESLTRFN